MTIAQFPNKNLILAAIAAVTSWLTFGMVSEVANAVYHGAILIWAGREIIHGVNWFRRTLGAVVFIVTTYHLIQGWLR